MKAHSLAILVSAFALNLFAASGGMAQPQGRSPAPPPGMPGNPPMPQQSPQAMEMQYNASLLFKYNVMGPKGARPLPAGAPSPFSAVGDGRDENGKPRWLDGPAGFNTLGGLTIRLLDREQFDDLERLLRDWNDPAERMADGRWKLFTFRHTFEAALSQTGDWAHFAAVIERWKNSAPNSISAALAEGIYWKTYAWDARGQGATGSISTTGRQLFRERMEKAEALMRRSKSYAAANPVWYDTYIGILSALNWDKAKVYAIASEAAEKHRHYFAAYSTMAHFSAPKWGGSWELLDAFVTAAAKNTEDLEGKSNYTRLYWHIVQYEQIEFDLFKHTMATWPQMRSGFEDMLKRYPHSMWNVNNFAAFACRAGDGKTFNELLPRVQTKVMREAWPSNYSFDLCQNKFARGLL